MNFDRGAAGVVHVVLFYEDSAVSQRSRRRHQPTKRIKRRDLKVTPTIRSDRRADKNRGVVAQRAECFV